MAPFTTMAFLLKIAQLTKMASLLTVAPMPTMAPLMTKMVATGAVVTNGENGASSFRRRFQWFRFQPSLPPIACIFRLLAIQVDHLLVPMLIQ